VIKLYRVKIPSIVIFPESKKTNNVSVYMVYFLSVEIFFLFTLAVLVRYSLLRHRYFLHMAQLNGYKSNEFWVWIKHNWSKDIVPFEYYFIYIILALHLLGYKYVTLTTHTLILSFAVLFWFFSIKRYRQKQKKTLSFTPRMLRQTITSVALTLPVLVWGFTTAFSIQSEFIHPTFLLSSIAATGFLAPFYILLAGIINKPLENSIQNGFKKQASKKVKQFSDLKVIGITGSYGKTSTKFMIRDLLNERFSVLATPGSYNTPMGICKVINQDLTQGHQVLVLEMGARYKGNIQELCEIAPPNISVVTNVGKAHLETFGSQQAIAETKAELVQHMASGGVSFLNANDLLVLGMSRVTTSQIITAGIDTGDYQATDIRYDQNGCSFTVITPEEQAIDISMPLLGAHNVQNMVLAIALAHYMGLRLETIALAAKRMQPIEHRLELKRQNDILIIDDAFNSNPVGAKNAVEILAKFTGGKRIIITPGMVELGDREFEENELLGREIGKYDLEKVLFVGKKRSEPLVKGYLAAGGAPENMVVVSSLFEANELIKPLLTAGDIILYENDLPDSYNE